MPRKPKGVRCPVGVGFSSSGKAHLINCGQWSCARCRRINARHWAARARRHLNTHPPPDDPHWFMLTLTLGSEYTSVPQGYAGLVRLWDRLRKQFRRAYQSWSYVAFVEGQPNRRSMPHFHILTNRIPPARRNAHGVVTKHALHDWSKGLGWGYEVDLSAVDGPKAAAYVTKYVSKGTPEIPKGFRRVRASRGFTKLPKDPDRALIVPARGEGLGEFIARASGLTGVAAEELYSRWTEAWEVVYHSQDGVT